MALGARIKAFGAGHRPRLMDLYASARLQLQPKQDLLELGGGPYRWGNGQLDIVRSVQMGGGGIVYETKLTDCPGLSKKFPVAIKRVLPTHDGRFGELRERFNRESTLLDVLGSRYVVQYFDDNAFRHYIAMQWVARDLRHFWQQELFRPLVVADWMGQTARGMLVVLHLMFDLLSGLAELHGHGFVHRDIKMENLLVHCFDASNNEDCHLFLADFDMACSHDGGVHACDAPAGTGVYVPPEVWREVTRFEQTGEYRLPADRTLIAKHDIWAAGVVLHRLVRGDSLPDRFYSTRVMGNPMTAAKRFRRLVNRRSAKFDTGIARLMRRMLEVDERKRCTAEECLSTLTAFFPEARKMEEKATEHFKEMDEELQLIRKCLTPRTAGAMVPSDGGEEANPI